jgi:hypothetical protein
VNFRSDKHYFKFTFQSNDVQTKDHFDQTIIVQTLFGRKFFGQTFFSKKSNDVCHPKQNIYWFSCIDILDATIRYGYEKFLNLLHEIQQ